MGVGLAGLVLLLIVVFGSIALLVPASTIAAGTSDTAAGRALIERFVDRSRRFRTVGGAVGILISIAVTSSRPDAAGQGSISVELLPALAGAVLGSIIAESFRVRQPRGPREASLEIRQETDYTDAVADRRESIIGSAAAVMTVLGAMRGSWLTIILGATIGGISLVRRWAQHRVVMRGRPALEVDLAVADDEVRRMAVRHGLARPAVTLMTLLVAFQAAALQAGYPGASLIDQVLGLASLALSMTGVVWWWTNRNFGFRPREAGGGRPAAIALGAILAIVFLGAIAVRFGG